jgi:transposase InsO family protein
VPEQRFEFVVLAESGSVPFAVLCRRFGIKRDTGYKWLARYRAEGEAGLVDRSRAPRSSPWRTDPEMEELVCAARRVHPAWGGRKLRGFLLRQGHVGVPAASTITAILRRNGLLEPAVAPRRDFMRFEREAPNELWQMDFKGDFKLADGGRCYPFGVIDDYSRYSISLVACPNFRTGTVKAHLGSAFGRYGLPEAMLMDNGSPWGNDRHQPWTPLTVWLADLGIEVIHSAPYHPQTNGKKERLHLTLDLEVLNTRPQWGTLDEVQEAFEAWEPIYNHHRPHQALGETTVPADRYRPSPRSMPDRIDDPAYPDHWELRKVDSSARAQFHNRRVRTGKAFRGRYVAFAPTTEPDIFHIYWRHHLIRTIDLSTMSPNARPRTRRS